MSYVAEPYAQFVDDLLTGMTGGSVRQRFVFSIDDSPFRLDARGALLPGTVRVFGQAGGAFTRFLAARDYVLADGHSIRWLEAEAGSPAAAAVWPDEGSAFFVNFEVRAAFEVVPPLTDRNPGSITRLLAESFGREYAVLSGQLEKVYKAGFLETATGRDLDALARLVGVRRRTGGRASGTVVFSRRTPAAADVFVPAGIRVSTSEPPPVIFETTTEGILRRGTLSVEAPIEALAAGVKSSVASAAVTVIHRPILGIETVTNPAPVALASQTESDEALRSRVSSALEGSGKATTGALIAALTGESGLAEKDLRLAEDHLAHPGLVKLTAVFPDGGEAEEEQERRVARAIEAIEETRPVGVRIEPNFHHAQPVSVDALPVPGALRDDVDGEQPPAEVVAMMSGDAPFLPVGVRAVIVPVSAALTPDQRLELSNAARDRLAESFERFGIGDFVVYNRLVADLMALDGVLDVDLELAIEGAGDAEAGRLVRKSLIPKDSNLRPTLAAVDVQVGAQLVLLDVSVAVSLTGVGTLGDPAGNGQAARAEIEDRLRQNLSTLNASEFTPAVLSGLIGTSENYVVTQAHYEANYVEAGVRMRLQDPTLPLTGLERLWIGDVRLLDEEGA